MHLHKSCAAKSFESLTGRLLIIMPGETEARSKDTDSGSKYS